MSTAAYFAFADSNHPVHASVQSDAHYVQMTLKPKFGSDINAHLTPKQARRVADALRLAAREAEDNGRPYVEEPTDEH